MLEEVTNLCDDIFEMKSLKLREEINQNEKNVREFELVIVDL